jgi:molybdopterin converting factor small subunit
MPIGIRARSHQRFDQRYECITGADTLHGRTAVEEYAADGSDEAFGDGDEIALLPPVTGG